MTPHAQTPPVTGYDRTWAQAVDVTGRLLLQARQAFENDQFQQIFICPFKNKFNNWNSVLTLQRVPFEFQWNSSGSGCDLEWVDMEDF
jgi:hypothetical protein